ncbi:unnamed protein product [Cyprideis torosa]|uniref:Uncharacterized protein n=1 Tax=Cyprideis torosa TaxID=163714 RepID=A0A7R8WA97_9CRUS|nr:unnamed protein product [Cyprideis torosa]CAG0886133.1 unnamed protein product [Cyprideis torosa]
MHIPISLQRGHGSSVGLLFVLLCSSVLWSPVSSSVVGDFFKTIQDQVYNFRDTARLAFRLMTGEEPEQVEEYFEYSSPNGGPPVRPPLKRQDGNQRRRPGGPDRQQRPFRRNQQQRQGPNNRQRNERPFRGNAGPKNGIRNQRRRPQVERLAGPQQQLPQQQRNVNPGNRIETLGGIPDGLGGYSKNSFYPVPVANAEPSNKDWKPAAEYSQADAAAKSDGRKSHVPEYYGQGANKYEIVESSPDYESNAWDRMGVSASIVFDEKSHQGGQQAHHQGHVEEGRSFKRERTNFKKALGNLASEVIRTLQNVLEEEQRKMRAGEPTTIELVLEHLQKSREAINALDQFPDKMDPEIKAFLKERMGTARQGFQNYMESFRQLVQPIREQMRSMWDRFTSPFERLFQNLASRWPVPQVKLPKRFVDETVNGFGFRLLQRFREAMGIQPHSSEIPRPGEEDVMARGLLGDSDWSWDSIVNFLTRGRRRADTPKNYPSSSSPSLASSRPGNPGRAGGRPGRRRPSADEPKVDSGEYVDDEPSEDYGDDNYDFIWRDEEEDSGFGHRIRNFLRDHSIIGTRNDDDFDLSSEEDRRPGLFRGRLRSRMTEAKRSIAAERQDGVIGGIVQDPFVTLSGISFAAFLTALFFTTVGGQQEAKDIPFPQIASLNNIPIPESVTDFINSFTNVYSDAEKSKYFLRKEEDLMGPATASGGREVKSFEDEPCPKRRLCCLMVKAIRDEENSPDTDKRTPVEERISTAFRENFSGGGAAFKTFVKDLTDRTKSSSSPKEICDSLVPDSECPSLQIKSSEEAGMVAHSVCRATAEPQVVDSLRMGAPEWERPPQSKTLLLIDSRQVGVRSLTPEPIRPSPPQAPTHVVEALPKDEEESVKSQKAFAVM